MFKTMQKCSKCAFTGTSFKIPKRKHNTTQLDSPKYQPYSRHSAQMQFYASWPTNSNQKAENLSEAGFFFTGKVLR
jgi:hypothetical protein